MPLTVVFAIVRRTELTSKADLKKHYIFNQHGSFATGPSQILLRCMLLIEHLAAAY
jgi:hypothetical protein